MASEEDDECCFDNDECDDDSIDENNDNDEYNSNENEGEDAEEDEYEDECVDNKKGILSSIMEFFAINTQGSLNLPSDMPLEITHVLIKSEERKAIYGLITGFVCILLGVILSIIGVTGFINWSFAFGGINSSLTNAAPGVLLMIIGFLIIIITNYKVTVKK